MIEKLSIEIKHPELDPGDAKAYPLPVTCIFLEPQSILTGRSQLISLTWFTATPFSMDRSLCFMAKPPL